MIVIKEGYKPEFFFIQLAEVAPATILLLQTYPSRLTGSVTTGDVINRYGIAIRFHVQIDIFIEKCRHCGETQFSKVISECAPHRSEMVWQPIADGEDKDIREALKRADLRVRAWLKKRGIEFENNERSNQQVA